MTAAKRLSLLGFSAGSHIDVALPNGTSRQYSLCNDPSERHRYLIGVLKSWPTARMSVLSRLLNWLRRERRFAERPSIDRLRSVVFRLRTLSSGHLLPIALSALCKRGLSTLLN